MTLDTAVASKFASLALAHVTREYPNKLDHVLNGPEDVRSPSELHPVFYGSFDWHSNVHGYWLLATLLREVPSLPQAGDIRTLFDAQLTTEKVAGELAYLARPNRGGFERPYGWAWLLMVDAELRRHGDSGAAWSTALTPLGDAFAERLRAYVGRLTYPIRVGTHFNSAFAVALSMEYARAVGDRDLEALLRERAMAWFGSDRACQAWEPGGDDFLSSALMEAECMRRILPADEWRRWFDAFLPDLAKREPRTLFTPAFVSDRTDGKIAHLDGLNLSRAWCMRSIASSLANGDLRRDLLQSTAREHLDVSLSHVAGDYAGEHWLATYGLLAVSGCTCST